MPKLKPKVLWMAQKAITGLQSIDAFAQLVHFAPHQVALQSLHPHYHFFEVPKRNGQKRLIENPNPMLKTIQSRLNFHLQAIYWRIKPTSAYGFILNPDAERYEPRSILTNAEQHLGKTWLLNADLKDFFHHIHAEQVFRIFTGKPFGFQHDLAELLTCLTTYAGRLPMGAPTSPVLSNFAFLEADAELLAYAHAQSWTFTRYADDLTFSSNEPIDLQQITATETILKKYGFEYNWSKVHVSKPDDEKIITGLRLNNEAHKVELPEAFSIDFEKATTRLKNIMTVKQHLTQQKTDWVEQYQKQIEGKLSFAAQILGKKDAHYKHLRGLYQDAMAPLDEFESISWLDFNYF
jgi:RNA-directed DNA polymerase